jgi:hypothetical protein
LFFLPFILFSSSFNCFFGLFLKVTTKQPSVKIGSSAEINGYSSKSVYKHTIFLNITVTIPVPADIWCSSTLINKTGTRQLCKA